MKIDLFPRKDQRQYKQLLMILVNCTNYVVHVYVLRRFRGGGNMLHAFVTGQLNTTSNNVMRNFIGQILF